MKSTMLETLEGRQMYSATMLTDTTYEPPVQESAVVAAKKASTLKIRLSDILISSYSGKVAMQDFHFVAKVSKASPKLFL
jgi:hypothetical protein